MYSQGMTPVCKVDLGKSEKTGAKFSKASWSRIKEIPTYQVSFTYDTQVFIYIYLTTLSEQIKPTNEILFLR